MPQQETELRNFTRWIFPLVGMKPSSGFSAVTRVKVVVLQGVNTGGVRLRLAVEVPDLGDVLQGDAHDHLQLRGREVLPVISLVTGCSTCS